MTRSSPLPRIPLPARIYVSLVIAAGAWVVLAHFPRSFPRPILFLSLAALAVATSSLRVSLPLSTGSATMSVSYVVDLMAVLLLGPSVAMVTGGLGAWAQCIFSGQRKTGLFKTLFSIAALVLSVRAASAAFSAAGGVPGALTWTTIGRPLLAAVAAYYVGNTALVAGAIGLTSGEGSFAVWRRTFLWTAPSYLVGALVAAGGAWLVESGGVWFAPLAVAPGYLTYRTHKLYLARIADGRRHVTEITALHEQAVQALQLAKQSQHELAAEKERLTVTLRSLGEAVTSVDLQGRIVLLNPAAEAFTGRAQQEAIGRPFHEVVRLRDAKTGAACESPVEVILRTQQAVEPVGRTVLVAADGTTRLVEYTGTPLRSDEGGVEGAVLVLRDVSDALRLEQERQKADRLESLGVLAGGIAHDFNNILTAIVGNVSIARADPGLDAVAGAHLREAEQACVRAKTLTRQLLTFSKGGAPIKKTASLNDLVREAAGFALRGTNVSCDFLLADDLWSVEVDEGQMVQVVNNLVINAQQAMPGGGTIAVRTFNVASAPGERAGEASFDEVRICVEDHGVGIAEENLPRIFDPYFTTKRAGSGLGLATVYSIVRNHGGRIEIKSELGQGTTVLVTLPGYRDRVPARRQPEPSPRPGKGRVLVMDDEEAIRKLARAMLGRLGYEVEVAADGREAIAMYQEALEADRPFDVVMMDLTVPGGIGGKDAIGHLVRLNPGVRAIVSSGYADDPVMADFQRYGFKAIVPKPFGSAELSAALEQVLS